MPGREARQEACRLGFIPGDDGSAFFGGLFSISGQRFCFPRRMAPSSRSRARPVGFWQLRTRSRTMRHACAGWYRTPHSRSIRSATRADVHGPPSYPSASGPRLNMRSIRRSSAVPNRGLRPTRPDLASDLRLSVMGVIRRRLNGMVWKPQEEFLVPEQAVSEINPAAVDFRNDPSAHRPHQPLRLPRLCATG